MFRKKLVLFSSVCLIISSMQHIWCKDSDHPGSIQPPKTHLSDKNMSLESLTMMGIDIEVAEYMLENDCDSIEAQEAIKKKKQQELRDSSWDLYS